MTDPTDKNEDKSEEGFFMAGFSGATGVPLKQMQDAIAQSTALKPNVYNYTGSICSSSATSSGDIFSYFSNLQDDAIYIVILSRLHYTWDDSASVYIAQHGSQTPIYGKLTIKEGSTGYCPKLDANGHVVLPSVSQYSITITLIQLISY